MTDDTPNRPDESDVRPSVATTAKPPRASAPKPAAKTATQPSAVRGGPRAPASRKRASGARTAAAAPARATPSAKPSARKGRGRTAGKAASSTAKKFSSAVKAAAVDAATSAAPVTEAIENAAERTVRTVGKTARTAKATVRRESATVKDRAKTATRDLGRSAGKARARAARAATGTTAKALGAAAAGLVAGFALNLGRKVIVQAPSTLAGDWLAAIKAEHKLVLALFDKLQATDSSQTAQRTTLLAQLKHALGKHAFTEENVIYPALRAWGDKADADKLNHDHGYVKQYLYELDVANKASPAFLGQVGDFRAAVETHVREEEDAIFPPLHRSLGKAGNAKLTAQANKEGFKLA